MSLEASAQVLSESQEQTKGAFGFQWQLRDAFESDAVHEQTRRWLVERYLNDDPSTLTNWLSGGRKRILDAGCGAGLSGLALFGDQLHDHDYVGVDIAPGALETAKARFEERGYRAAFMEADLATVDLAAESFDLIISEGVLHHTDDPRASFLHLASLLKPEGRFAFYVYKVKAPLREYADDHVRDAIADLTDEEAWEALAPLTRLGQSLGELNVEIDVAEDVPFLGIKKGRYDLQRFFYWNVCKLFYRADYSFEEMHHVNFDWYRPANCSRHTPEEVRGWCEEAGLSVENVRVEEAGITVIAKKP